MIIPGRAFIISFFDAFKLVDFKHIIAKSTINNTDKTDNAFGLEVAKWGRSVVHDDDNNNNGDDSSSTCKGVSIVGKPSSCCELVWLAAVEVNGGNEGAS